MKRKILMTGLAALMLAGWLSLLPLAGMGAGAKAEPEEENEAEWTVMFYLCGSDLESKYSYATGNLGEIAECWYPENLLSSVAEDYEVTLTDFTASEPGTVNVVIQTGGCKEWHAQELGMDVDPTVLQRWSYHCYPDSGEENGLEDGFTLETSVPLASMAAPETLTDFINWSMTQYPAEKYALVLWDHGGGSKVGLFIDELFDGDVMHLDELRQALEKSDAQLELVLIDACLMANIETAWILEDFANWMVASEEVVPGKGTATGDWLQQLYNHPECDGKQLGRWICDTTQLKYAKEDDPTFLNMLTWSVIDLSKVEQLAHTMSRLFRLMNEAYKNFPSLMATFMNNIRAAEEYGDGQQSMRDIESIILVPQTVYFMERGLRNDLLDALEDTVVYNVRGGAHSSANGISFCYAAGFTPEEMEVFCRNCENSYYLALLDAVSAWTAPEWVYEEVERLPQIEELEDYQITVEKVVGDNGIPGILPVGNTLNISGVYYRLYRKNEQTENTVRLGRTTCGFSKQGDGTRIWMPEAPEKWITVEDRICCAELIREENLEMLYNIPVQIGTDVSSLRCERTLSFNDEGEFGSTFGVTGIWQGYNADSSMANRTLKKLSELSGRTYQLLFPIRGENGSKTLYEPGEEDTLYRQINVAEGTLSPGTYWLEYEIDDMFQRAMMMEPIEMEWDGSSMTFPGLNEWNGTVNMNGAE